MVKLPGGCYLASGGWHQGASGGIRGLVPGITTWLLPGITCPQACRVMTSPEVTLCKQCDDLTRSDIIAQGPSWGCSSIPGGSMVKTIQFPWNARGCWRCDNVTSEWCHCIGDVVGVGSPSSQLATGWKMDPPPHWGSRAPSGNLAVWFYGFLDMTLFLCFLVSGMRSN